MSFHMIKSKTPSIHSKMQRFNLGQSDAILDITETQKHFEMSKKIWHCSDSEPKPPLLLRVGGEACGKTSSPRSLVLALL